MFGKMQNDNHTSPKSLLKFNYEIQLCPFFMEETKKRQFSENSCFQASQLNTKCTEEKNVLLLRSCISKELKSIHSSPLKSFSWPQLSCMFFSQQAVTFRAMLCAGQGRPVLLNQPLW